MNSGIFLDLDWTIIKPESGNTFPKNASDWMFIDGMMNTVKAFTDKGYVPIIVTNQGGIDAGHVDESAFNDKMLSIVGKMEGHLETNVGYSYCAGLTDDNGDKPYRRKPNPGMAFENAVQYHLRLQTSIMVGDSDSDHEFAINAGIGKFYFTHEFIHNFINSTV